MKLLKLNLFFLVLFIFSCKATSGGGVPKAVVKSFQQKYPGEKDPNWEVDKNGFWEAKFKQGGTKLEQTFRVMGNGLKQSPISKKVTCLIR